MGRHETGEVNRMEGNDGPNKEIFVVVHNERRYPLEIVVVFPRDCFFAKNEE